MKIAVTFGLLFIAIFCSLNIPQYEVDSEYHFIQDFEKIKGWSAGNNIEGISSLDSRSGNYAFLLDSLHKGTTFFEASMKLISPKKPISRARINAKVKWIEGEDPSLYLICNFHDGNSPPVYWDRFDVHYPLVKGEWVDVKYEFTFKQHYKEDRLIGFYFETSNNDNQIFLDDFTVDFF